MRFKTFVCRLLLATMIVHFAIWQVMAFAEAAEHELVSFELPAEGGDLPEAMHGAHGCASHAQYHAQGLVALAPTPAFAASTLRAQAAPLASRTSAPMTAPFRPPRVPAAA